MSKTPAPKVGWFVIRNLDLTEGRGRPLVNAVCEIEATARRLSKDCDTQGGDGQIARCALDFADGWWRGPVVLVPPTDEDIAVQKHLDEVRDAMERARKAGLSSEDITTLVEARLTGKVRR
jgi:hypothetical protein